MHELKGLDGSNPPLSTSQSVHFTYILEKAKTPRGMWRSFYPQRTGEGRLTSDSPEAASILSVRSKNGSLQRRNALRGSPNHRPSATVLWCSCELAARSLPRSISGIP